jgi:hypothetical protein
MVQFILASDWLGDRTACFKLVYPVMRKSALSWREAPVSARHVGKSRDQAASKHKHGCRLNVADAFSSGIAAYSPTRNLIYLLFFPVVFGED